MYRSVQLSRLPISLRESPPAKSRINFARFTNSAANDRLRARRFNSLRSGGANTSRFRFMHSIYQKCYTSHELIALVMPNSAQNSMPNNSQSDNANNSEKLVSPNYYDT